jgi:hypothetical protein
VLGAARHPVEVLGAAQSSRIKHVAFLSGLLVLFGTEELWEHICGGQGAEGEKPCGVLMLLSHDLMMAS